jgi:hypothetical protein
MSVKHFHYEVLAYETENRETNTYHHTVKIIVQDCTTESGAIEKVKALIDRPFYRVVGIEECGNCASHDDQIAVQRYLAASMAKHHSDEDK